MDLLQEAFIHALEPCEARFIMDACTKTPAHCNDNA